MLALIERNGDSSASKAGRSDEESPHHLMATRREDAPALFQNLAGDRSGSSILSNMLGASRSRYGSRRARPSAFDRRADQRDRAIMNCRMRRCASPGAGAGQRDRFARQRRST